MGPGFLEVVLAGFEPTQTVPKTVVLPLHHKTILVPNPEGLKHCKITTNYFTTKIFSKFF